MSNESITYNRAKIWQIGGFALNNAATNLYLFFMNFIAYYMNGYLGVGVVLASTFLTGMRVWDAVTDPFLGFVVDRTTTKFGKNRPFMLLGNLLMAASLFLMVFVSHRLPGAIKFPFFVIFYLLYVVGYTFQCIATKSGQSCLTNDPKQRPLFTIFDGINVTIVFSVLPILFTSILPARHGGFTDTYFQEAWRIIAPISLILTLIAIFSLASKDRPENFGTGRQQMVHFKDYWDVLKNNRAIQMLVVSASTDKLALQTQGNATINVIIFGIVCGNYALNGALNAYTSIPTFLFLLFGAGWIATRLGQKKAMMFGTYGSLVCCALLALLFYVGDPTTMGFPGFEGFNGWTFFSLSYVILWVGFKGFSGVSGNIVLPMIADCTDYEVYRSGRYVPGLMGTLFSLVDKIVSSLATTVVGLMCAAIGFTEALPAADTPFTPALKFVGVFGLCGLTMIGLITNVIAMKFYPLTGEKMKEIQAEVAAIKAKAAAEEANA